jgi:hypothetical protein
VRRKDDQIDDVPLVDSISCHREKSIARYSFNNDIFENILLMICPELTFADDHQIISIDLADYFKSGLLFGQTTPNYG